MKTLTLPALDNTNVAWRLSLCAASLAGTAATVSHADAALITFTTPIVIPANSGGVYINLLTGATGGSASAVSGWDFNPYLAATGSQLGFYWDQSASLGGGVSTTASAGSYLDLAAGTSVSSASTFSQAVGLSAGSPYLTTGTHILGFKFLNETTSAVNYGYLTMTNTATNGFPATITRWTFDNTGAAVTVVPEPATGALLSMAALALGAVQMRALRKQKRQPSL